MEVFLKDKPLESAKKFWAVRWRRLLRSYNLRNFCPDVAETKVLAAALLDSEAGGYKRLLVDITSPSDKPLMLGFSQ